MVTISTKNIDKVFEFSYILQKNMQYVFENIYKCIINLNKCILNRQNIKYKTNLNFENSVLIVNNVIKKKCFFRDYSILFEEYAYIYKH